MLGVTLAPVTGEAIAELLGRIKGIEIRSDCRVPAPATWSTLGRMAAAAEREQLRHLVRVNLGPGPPRTARTVLRYDPAQSWIQFLWFGLRDGLTEALKE